MMGDAMSVNMLERLLPAAPTSVGLYPPASYEDHWDKLVTDGGSGAA